jgi:hypothetical protein
VNYILRSAINFREPAFSHNDRFAVTRLDGKPVESWFNAERAERAAGILNDHNEKNGHATRFEVRQIVDTLPEGV